MKLSELLDWAKSEFKEVTVTAGGKEYDWGEDVGKEIVGDVDGQEVRGSEEATKEYADRRTREKIEVVRNRIGTIPTPRREWARDLGQPKRKFEDTFSAVDALKAEVPLAGASLLPCPFCGDPSVGLQKNGKRGSHYWEVVCTSCDIVGPCRTDPKRAAEEWNTRHSATGAPEDDKKLAPEPGGPSSLAEAFERAADLSRGTTVVDPNNPYWQLMAATDVGDAMVEAACLAYWPAHWRDHMDEKDKASIRLNVRRAIRAAMVTVVEVAYE